MVTATKPAPTLRYNRRNQIASVTNAYPVKEVLKAGGFRWNDAVKAWQRRATIGEFEADWLLLQNLGVELDESTAAFMLQAPAKPVQREYSNSTVETAPQQPVQPPRQPLPAPKPTPMARLIAAREIVMRIAASGRITDPEDLRDFRTVACAIKTIVDAQAESEWEDMEYGIHAEAAS